MGYSVAMLVYQRVYFMTYIYIYRHDLSIVLATTISLHLCSYERGTWVSLWRTCSRHWKTCHIPDYMDVSKNRGFSPQIIPCLIGFSLIFTIHFGGFPPIFGNTHIWRKSLQSRLLHPSWLDLRTKKTSKGSVSWSKSSVRWWKKRQKNWRLKSWSILDSRLL